MSVGVFLGVKGSFIPEAQKEAVGLINRINKALAEHGLPEYVDPLKSPDVYVNGRFGRSALDHDGAGNVCEIAQLAAKRAPNGHLAAFLKTNVPFPFAPFDFPNPIFWRGFFGSVIVASAVQTHRELITIAKDLAIPLDNGKLADDVAERVNDYADFDTGEKTAISGDLKEYRTTWLTLFEATRLSSLHQVALVIH